MQDPKVQLTDWLDRLVNKCLWVNAIRRELNTIHDWAASGRFEPLEAGRFFFRLVQWSLADKLYLDVTNLAAERECQSLPRWLDQARTHGSLLMPVRYDFVQEDYVPLSVDEYHIELAEHTSKLKGLQSVVDAALARRDKHIAHWDRKYFTDPDKFQEDFPLDSREVELLIDTLAEILAHHHARIKRSGIEMNIHSGRRVDVVLNHVRAAQRMWKDGRLLAAAGVRIADYFEDDDRPTRMGH